MKRINFFILFLLLLSIESFSQDNLILEGTVTFISSQNVYVKFENTDGMNAGDTLFTKSVDNFFPSLVVKHLSSSSLACERLNDDEVKVGDKFFARISQSIEENKIITPVNIPNVVTLNQPSNKEESDEESDEDETKFSGRYSIQSYSNFNNVSRRGDYQRWRHSLRFSLEKIGGLDLSLSSYTIFAYKADEWNLISNNLSRALKIYDLSLGIGFDESTRLWLGRHLNRKISNISTVDGIQFEKDISNFSFGLVAGSRPNFTDFGFNLKLFEYGIYVNRIDTAGNGLIENTISFFQQTNNLKTDRRFLYFQHSNSAIERINIFASAEVDLYKREFGKEQGDFSITGLFISARYAPIREVSFNASYDARKNVIYYETFKSFTDSLIENETRQGFRFRTNIKPVKALNVGLMFGYRYKKTDLKPGRNFGGVISYSQIPFIESSLSISYNRILNSYLKGNIFTATVMKSFIDINSDISFSYRRTNYEFLNSTLKTNENSILADFSTNILRQFYLSVGYEGIFESNHTFGRILLGLTTRF